MLIVIDIINIYKYNIYYVSYLLNQPDFLSVKMILHAFVQRCYHNLRCAASLRLGYAQSQDPFL